jgi:hypothetical protein
MTMFIDNQKIEGLLDHSAWRTGLSPVVVSASTINLTSQSPSTYYYTGTTAGQIVRFPDATTLSVGHRYEFWNAATVTVVVQSFAGTNAFNVFPNFNAHAVLLDNSTAAGIWGIDSSGIGAASGIINYKVTATAAFSPGTALTPVTSMTVTPLPGTYAIWFNSSAQIVTNNIQTSIFIYNGASVVADATRLVQNSVSTFNTILSTQTTATFNGSTACTVQTSRTGGTMTMTGRSLILIRLGD